MRFLLLLVLLFFAGTGYGEVPVPPLSGRVVDLSSVLSASEKGEIEGRLQELERAKGSQLAVLILPSTGEESIEQFGIRVADAWKLGRKGIDDGAILIVALNDRNMRIEVGYGLEGVLNDAVSKRIVSDIIAPYFKNGQIYSGIDAGIGAMIKVVEGESLPAPKTGAASSASFGDFLPVAFVIALVLGSVLRMMLGRLPGALVAGALTSIVIWFVVGTIVAALVSGLFAFIYTLLGGGRGFGGGIGGFGGGGGFSGGGGGFGGGGASGRW